MDNESYRYYFTEKELNFFFNSKTRIISQRQNNYMFFRIYFRRLITNCDEMYSKYGLNGSIFLDKFDSSDEEIIYDLSSYFFEARIFIHENDL